MKLYLDDNLASPLLAQLLHKAGHDVRLPVDVGLVSKDDPVHLTHAVLEGRVSLTLDHGDFLQLHDLVQAVQGNHPGILVVQRDNDSKKDLDEPGVVRAIRKLLAAGVPIANEYIVLNYWR